MIEPRQTVRSVAEAGREACWRQRDRWTFQLSRPAGGFPDRYRWLSSSPPIAGFKAPPTAPSIWQRASPMSRNSRSSRFRNALIAARRSQRAARAYAQIPIQRTNPPNPPEVARRAAPEKITVMSVLQSASARQSDAAGADAGRQRQHLGDEGLLSHPQCNGGVD